MGDKLADRDRTALVQRNQALAAKRHQMTWREHVRRWMLRTAALRIVRRPANTDKNTVLLIRPDHLGDVLLAMPAIQALKRAAPHLRLIGLAGPWSAEVMAAYPEIDMVLTLPFPGFTRRGDSLLAPYSLAWSSAQRIRKLGAGTAIIMRPDHWWGGMLAHWAGIPRRIGYDVPDVRPFLTESKRYQEQHSVPLNLGLVEAWTGVLKPDSVRLEFPIADADREYIRGLLAEHTGRRYVVIHPGASTPLKFWPPEAWAYVADMLASRLSASVIFTGSDREHQQIIEIQRRMKEASGSVAGDTNVAQLAALYERAAVVLGPDTGPLHVAVAAGAPTVHLFGPADPALFGPWGDARRQIALQSGIACQPCRILDWSNDNPANHPCVREITPGQVLETAVRIAR